MNIGILFTDISYDYEQSFENYKKYIIEPLNSLPDIKKIDCFLTHYNFYDLNEFDNLEYLCNKFNISRIHIPDKDYIYLVEQYNKIEQNDKYIRFYQFKWYYELYYSINQIESHSILNNFKYDVIILISLKCLFCELLKLNFEFNKDTIYVTTDYNNQNNYNDIVIGNIKSIKKFSNSYINFLDILGKESLEQNYLRFLKNNFDSKNVKIENLEIKHFIIKYIENKPKYIKKVTNKSDAKEGFGENFSYILKTIIYCEYYGYDYYYTPLNYVEHNYDSDPFFLEKKEELMNIKNNYKISSKNEKYHIPTQFELIHFFETNIDFCLKSTELEKLKNIFTENKIDRFDKNFTNVAIHIRRMNQHDIQYQEYYEGTDISNVLYTNFIENIKSIFNRFNKCLFHIYSQGEINDFKEFLNYDDIILHLNDTIENTYTDFVFADILLVAPSAFSYTAGMLSNGIVYSFSTNRKILPFWSIIENYESTKDKYSFDIKKTDSFILKVYFDPYLNGFYYQNKDNTKVYFNIHDIM